MEWASVKSRGFFIYGCKCMAAFSWRSETNLFFNLIEKRRQFENFSSNICIFDLFVVTLRQH